MCVQVMFESTGRLTEVQSSAQTVIADVCLRRGLLTKQERHQLHEDIAYSIDVFI